MTYKKQFDLNPSDIDLIETCLKNDLHIRSEQYQESAVQENAEEMASAEHRMSAITELLGKIHNQKIWYESNADEPLVPKG